MKLTSCHGLWDVDCSDQFYGTLESAVTVAAGWLSRQTDRTTKTFVFLNPSDLTDSIFVENHYRVPRHLESSSA